MCRKIYNIFVKCL